MGGDLCVAVSEGQHETRGNRRGACLRCSVHPGGPRVEEPERWAAVLHATDARLVVFSASQ